MSIDPRSEEVRNRDKRKAALHEAAHVFVGDALGLPIEDVELRESTGGGLYTKHWVGSVRWMPLPPEILEAFPAGPKQLQLFKERLFSLAGCIAEEVFSQSEDGESVCVEDVIEDLRSEWDSLSETDRRLFPDGADSVCENEVEAVLRLLNDGREAILEVADKLEEREFLSRRDLDELPGFRVHIPASPDLSDYDSWEVLKC